ncbi:MAG: nuclease-related domain-containing protein [Nakamurella sp.]
MDGDTVQITRWTRYGKDRLYIKVADGTQIGFWDLTTDRPHPTSPEHLRGVIDAAVDWKSDQLPEAPGMPETVRTETAGGPVSVEPLARPWRDLATTEAGAAARVQARAARDAAPVRTFIARVLGIHTDERAWRIGAVGEQKVAAQLARLAALDPRWRFIHAIPVGSRGADMDHLVIGPGGVFTVNAKHHPRAKIWVAGHTFLVNGTPQPYLRNGRHEATRAARLLGAATGFGVHVESLIVPVNADDLLVKSTPEGLHVIARSQVTRWFLQHGDVLPAEVVQHVYEAARRSSTWQK